MYNADLVDCEMRRSASLRSNRRILRPRRCFIQKLMGFPAYADMLASRKASDTVWAKETRNEDCKYTGKLNYEGQIRKTKQLYYLGCLKIY